MLKRLAKILWAGLLFTQCSEDEQPRVNGPDFFPLSKGRYWIYQVMETTFSPLQPPAADTFQLRVYVADSFPNAEGGFTYVLHRFTRQSESHPWDFTDTWSARVTPEQVIVSEGNTAFVPLAFPVYTGRRWNGNLYNSLGDDQYQISSIQYSPVIFEHTIADQAITVIRENVNSNLTYRDVRTEIFGKDIGLVYKLSEVWNYTCSGGTCTGQINNGFRWIQSLVSYGNN